MRPSLAAFPPSRTERLTIRPLVMEDAEEIRGITDDPAITDVVHFLHAPFLTCDDEALISINGDENCFLGVWRRSELIGVVGAPSSAPKPGWSRHSADPTIGRLRKRFHLHAGCRSSRANEPDHQESKRSNDTITQPTTSSGSTSPTSTLPTTDGGACVEVSAGELAKASSPGILVPAHTVPAPRSVSAEAQAFLPRPSRPAPAVPTTITPRCALPP
jgi:hypothetical protein